MDQIVFTLEQTKKEPPIVSKQARERPDSVFVLRTAANGEVFDASAQVWQQIDIILRHTTKFCKIRARDQDSK